MNKNNLLVVLLLALIVGAIYFLSMALEQIFFAPSTTSYAFEEEYIPADPEPVIPPQPPTPEEEAARRDLKNSTILSGTAGDKLFNFLLSEKRDYTRELYELKYHQFDNQETPKDSLQLELNELAKVMNAYLGLKIEVISHTDGTGDWNVQQKTSALRADNIKAFLVEKGVDAAQINTTGYGDSYPIADFDTERGRAMNKRVEIVIRGL
jgi:outer membrane protein OmpA-like peptidoglycan-associated protein